MAGMLGRAARSVVHVRRFVLVAHELGEAGEPVGELPAGVIVAPIGRDHLHRLPDGPRARVAAWLSHGEVVLVAWLDGRFAGLIRLFAGPYPRNPYAVPVELGDGEVYADGLFVRPGLRGRGIGIALMRARSAHARAAGARAVLSHVQPSNATAMRVQARLGTAVRENVTCVVVGRRLRLTRRRPTGGSSR